ncbi:N,N-dimethylformamidase beta subunit family domain-containing protein [Anabaena sp. UHCC 0399]|uniref:N,N-dimethylformamidase beta subunit family domain-containing protein n=1 Tax=Anabaena sp. UHCC 0399 TaxID=3110238 RepID=UPI003A4C6B78
MASPSGNLQTVLTTQVPSIQNATDNSSYELGMKFRSVQGGQITAIRFWKASNEAGTHIGKIWSATGTLLGSVTFNNETTSGWQQQLLATPVSIQSNTTYVVSVNINAYYVISYNELASPIVNGDLSSVADGNNGVFNGTPGNFPTNSYQNSNYYRDINFVAVAQPTITKISGDNQNGAAGATLTNPLVVQVKDSAGNSQSGVTVNFAVTTGGGSVSPTSAVTDGNGQANTTLTLGAISGATLPVTNNVSATADGIGSVTFSATANPSGNLQTVLTSQVPSIPNATDGTGYELGMKFRSIKGGQITAIRFWKAPSETGTHSGKIWSVTGTLLVSVTFANETASGWQEQLLNTPINFLPNTTYVVSVNANAYYAVTDNGLGSSIVNGDLSSVADGNNGVYSFTPNSFPTNSYRNSNYYRDIVVIPGSTFIKVSGDNQFGATGVTLANPLVVRVLNAQNNPQPGVTVEFAITSGGGSLSSTSVVTDGSGYASTFLTLGTVPTGPAGVVVTATAAGIGSDTFLASATPPNPNQIYLENTNPGTTNWKLLNRASGEIAGYASATSINTGGSLAIKVSLTQPGQFTIDVYRLGYYGGTGGRLIVSSGLLNGITQPACTLDPNTRLIECNWSTSYTLQTNNWTSGMYVAKLTDQGTGKEAHVWFVVRDDSSSADILFQSAVSTVLAYSPTGGHSLYGFNSIGGQRALKVSYDRPYYQASYQQSNEADTPLRWEYNMLRWLESQAYDVTYTDNMQVHSNGQSLQNHKVFLSVGHDEYWSKEMRDAVETARSASVNLGFFSANTCYWRVRFENSTLAAGQVQPNRVMACYKQDWSLDPVAQQQGSSAATNKFRSVQNQRPENALLGVMYGGDTSDIYGGFNFTVTNSSDPYYANTGLQDGEQLSLLVGYEWDFIVNNGSTPAGLVILSQSSVAEAGSLPPTFDEPPGEISLPSNQDYSKAQSVRYTASSGAKVFASGTIQWAWGLDSDDVGPAREDIRVKQITVNILADMAARPQSPSPNLIVP